MKKYISALRGWKVYCPFDEGIRDLEGEDKTFDISKEKNETMEKKWSKLHELLGYFQQLYIDAREVEK